METEITTKGSEVVIKVVGRIDTTTASELSDSIKNSLTGRESVIFDLEDLDYISSAGLRVMLTTQKLLSSEGGKMKVINSKDSIREIFSVTGFLDIFSVE